MIKRFAIFEGHIPADRRKAFQQAVVERLLPAVRKLPGVNSVAANFSFERDEGAPEIALILTTTYRTYDTLKTALEGPQRKDAQRVTEQIFSEFAECRIHHHLTKTLPHS
ncbi:hypothetical protein [Hoeflea prorocentri]|uniref:ABM domain-containing protein n=1 Tax=Hoeflea prorocentri TaxID=1922333 RepID=A0A9X3UMT1_9HYPH|nr:hypothetical protein [Hoeflea prorocentri]MCY6383740.1 hypothetical protein [Hoeflea prorocentri]MDA5401540.1 hypothetical protein [Hoeflea prorocentri]